MPETAALPVDLATAPEVTAKTLEDVVGEIPAFTARADDLVIPSSRFISREINCTKAKLTNLQKLQVTVRELRRHGMRDE